MKAAAIGCIFDKNYSQVLLLKRRDFPLWVPPGGGIESNETPEQAVLREVFEETGLKVRVQRYVGTWLPTNRLSSPSHIFECQPLGDLSKINYSDESVAIRFFAIDRLPKPFFFLHQEWIDAALCQLPQPLLVKMTQVTYKSALRLLCRFPLTFCRYLLSRFGLPMNS
jgi:8-oxo-dGTP diphosphatase